MLTIPQDTSQPLVSDSFVVRNDHHIIYLDSEQDIVQIDLEKARI